MKTVIVIPSRFGSSRLPGKPLEIIAGHSLIKRVWSLANAVEGIHDLIVATDDGRIYEHCAEFGAKVVLTDPNCKNGTERVYDALSGLNYKPDIIVNLQGDAVLTPPWIVQAIVDAMAKDADIQFATPAIQLNWKQYDDLNTAKKKGQTTGTLVTFDNNNNALYFSKNMIPNIRKRDDDNKSSPVFQHIGLYGYRYETLKEYLSLAPSALEQAEQLEQLRALENGINIKIVPVDYKGRSSWSIDNPEDIGIVESIIDTEGELVDLQ